MALREAALIKILESRIQNYQEMIEIAKASDVCTPELENRFKGRIEEAEGLVKLFKEEGTDDESRAN